MEAAEKQSETLRQATGLTSSASAAPVQAVAVKRKFTKPQNHVTDVEEQDTRQIDAIIERKYVTRVLSVVTLQLCAGQAQMPREMGVSESTF